MPKTKITAGQLLFNAARDGDVEGLRSALGKRAPTDYKDAVSGMAALHMASCKGHTKIVKLLLDPDRGRASHALTTDGGSTPLALACLNRHTDVVSLLLKAGASANPPAGAKGPSPLAIACANGDEPVVKVLLENGATAAAALSPGGGAAAAPLPLLSSTLHGRPDIARLLLKHGIGLDGAYNAQGTLLFLPTVAKALMPYREPAADLRLHAIRASDVPDVDLKAGSGVSDPSVVFTLLQGEGGAPFLVDGAECSVQTQTLPNATDPVWPDALTLRLPEGSARPPLLRAMLWDRDYTNQSDPIGSAEVRLPRQGTGELTKIKLTGPKGAPLKTLLSFSYSIE